MRVSTRVEYGLIALTDIVLYGENGSAVSAPDIAQRENISHKYLEQILLLLEVFPAGFQDTAGQEDRDRDHGDRNQRQPDIDQKHHDRRPDQRKGLNDKIVDIFPESDIDRLDIVGDNGQDLAVVGSQLAVEVEVNELFGDRFGNEHHSAIRYHPAVNTVYLTT